MADASDSTPAPSAPRRGFLRGLAALPLIGGSVTVLGRPTAAAEPVTPGLLGSYATWLYLERVALVEEMEAMRGGRVGLEVSNPAWFYHREVDGLSRPAPSTRAAVVLTSVGCGWRA